MTLKRREEIAIWILVACAEAETDLIRSEDAAASAGVSQMQTAQIVHRLMRAGLIETVRGKLGGIRLNRLPEQITLGEVLRLVSGSPPPTLRPSRRNDPLAAIAMVAESMATQAFESFTIADIVQGRVDDKLVCFECSIRLGAVRHIDAGRRSATEPEPTPSLPSPASQQALPLGG